MTKQRAGEFERFKSAFSSDVISACNVEQIKQVLRLVMVKVGLRAKNWPTDEEKVILLDHIFENYGGNRVDEIKLAFDLAIAGKLDLDYKDVVCYENFSCLYFSTIMNAYRQWAVLQNQQIQKKELPPAPPTAEELKLIDDEYQDMLLNNAFRQFCQINKLPCRI